jgi:mono/diheme cytochrome c family protein
MSRLPDGEIFWKISKGRKPMPTFEQQLSRRERWDLVSYVRTLVRQAP